MLKIIKDLDPDKCNIVRWFEHFVHRGHTCLVFEMLDISLYDYWTSTFQPLSLLELSVITQQVSVVQCVALIIVVNKFIASTDEKTIIIIMRTTSIRSV